MTDKQWEKAKASHAKLMAAVDFATREGTALPKQSTLVGQLTEFLWELSNETEDGKALLQLKGGLLLVSLATSIGAIVEDSINGTKGKE